MAQEKIEKVSDKLKVISFISEDHQELSFGLLKDEDDLMVGDLNKSGDNAIVMTTTLSKKWLKDYLEGCIKYLKDTGSVGFRTPLGKYFQLTKKNIIALNDFLNSQDFIF